MGASTPDGHLTWYIFNYFGRFLTRAEGTAHLTYLNQEKAKQGRLPSMIQTETDDPEALALMTDDIEGFMRRTRDRIMREHSSEVFFSICSKCGGLAMTPKAQQCRWCFHDWHPT